MASADTGTDTDRLSAEHAALVTGCGLIDRSERGKLVLTGSGAGEFLNGQVTNEVAALRPGEGCYAAFLTHKGKMLGDLRILAVGEGDRGEQASAAGAPVKLLLDTERVALQELFDMIRRFKIGYDVELHKRTLESGLLSLIGPASRDVARRALEESTLTLGDAEHTHVPARIASRGVRLVSTDLGVDVLFAAPDAEPVRAALEFAGAKPVSEQAGEVVRVEHGRPRYGIDLDAGTIPQEAGLNERAVNFTKGCYVGQETVARLFYKGKPNRHLRGLRLSAPVAAGSELLLDKRVVGHLSSSVLSPALGPIGLALVRREAQPGDTLAVGEHGASAVVVELPFES
ncbi:MAG TPA: glycine cleavage T C-terminal barrel domain-containing protein [Solirubrobacteraceae bacterium]|nr:glycine cleavage T C-terminal barrel domain-containing protein [Solirubrobacteraceae bacterium]